MSESMTSTAVILRFDLRSGLCHQTGVFKDQFELHNTVGCRVVLREDFPGYARRDVLPAGRDFSEDVSVLSLRVF